MKTTANRKEIQDKLNNYITVLVKSVIDSESKKIKKSIKKASKSIAKAIMRKIKDSDGQISLEKKSDERRTKNKERGTRKEERRTKNEEKKKITAPVKRSRRKIKNRKTVKNNEVKKPAVAPKVENSALATIL